MSHLGYYAASLQLSRYYAATGDSLRQIGVWEEHAGLFPGDPRSYANELASIEQLTPDDNERKARAHVRWLAIDPGNAGLRSSAATACVAAGNDFFAREAYPQARSSYEEAVGIDSASALAYNGLGSVLAEEGKVKEAVPMFEEAIRLDPQYAYAYRNLGTAYHDLGEEANSVRHLRRAEELGLSAQPEKPQGSEGRK